MAERPGGARAIGGCSATWRDGRLENGEEEHVINVVACRKWKWDGS